MTKILGHTWKFVAAIFASIAGGLILNSYTKWWSALANITNAGWTATSEGLANAITHKIPIWAVIITVTVAALAWYSLRKIGRTINTPTPNTVFNFFHYREDVFDGVLCKWDYEQTPSGTQIRIESLLCYCQHCDFIIGRPNHHHQRCPSCSRRAVRSDDPPFYTNNNFQEEIAGYKRREDTMPFQNFILLEIDRRIRRQEWPLPEKGRKP